MLAALPAYAFVFVVVLARVGSATMLLAGFGEAEVPPTLRAGFALCLAALVLPVVGPGFAPLPPDFVGLASVLVCEILTGLWMGWLVRVLMQIPAMAGQVMAAATGLSNVIQPDAETGPQSSALAHALGLAAPVVVLASGLHALPLQALIGSYEVIAVGTVLPMVETASQAVEITGRGFAMALQLGGPFVVAGLVWQVALGLLTRLVPQLQIYFAAIPGQIAAGLLLFAALGGSALAVWQDGMRDHLLRLPGL